MLSRLLTLATDRIYNLPIIILMPHSRCNCRCVMCDIWKANQDRKEISAEELERHVGAFAKLKVREVVMSGGEALMHSNLWRLCDMLRKRGIKVTLLSTGLLLKKNEQDVVSCFDEVIVSLDGSRDVHNAIRSVPQAYEKLEEGVRGLKRIDPRYRVSARCVLQKGNYFDFENIVAASREIGLDRISFLGADVSTAAFNREQGWDREKTLQVALDEQECVEFERLIRHSFASLKDSYASGFIAERPEKMLRIVRYYKALNGLDEFPEPVCNAPWVSAVLESDGSLMPCFFHKPYGNVLGSGFMEVINSPGAISFRKKLDVRRDPICRKCVCSLKVGVTDMN